MTKFGELMKRLIAEKFSGQRDFVRIVEPTLDESSEQSKLSRIIAGRLPAPVARLGVWADALRLTGDARARFLDLGLRTNDKNQLLPIVIALERENAALRRELAEARAAIPPVADEPMRDLRSMMDPDEQPPSDPPPHTRPVALPRGARRDS